MQISLQKVAISLHFGCILVQFDAQSHPESSEVSMWLQQAGKALTSRSITGCPLTLHDLSSLLSQRPLCFHLFKKVEQQAERSLNITGLLCFYL